MEVYHHALSSGDRSCQVPASRAVRQTENAISKGSFVAQPYLCQVSPRVSCGACCGLYNIHNLTRAGLEAMLAARTAAFARVPRQARAIEDFGRRQSGWTPEDRPFPHFYHCPYAGLIGRAHSRVGCLLHPDAPGNAGRDWRELSYYGAKACRIYFCPTTRELRSAHQAIIRQGIDHWYLYGLVITEHRLWSAFFATLETRIGRPVVRQDFLERPEAPSRLQAFAALKLAWPFRRAQAPGPCNLFFDNACYPSPEVERKDPAIPLSPHEAIFRELESRFEDREAQQRAETMVERIFDDLAAIFSK
jgi:hypothetical protein